jgi:hypothetical protein
MNVFGRCLSPSATTSLPHARSRPSLTPARIVGVKCEALIDFSFTLRSGGVDFVGGWRWREGRTQARRAGPGWAIEAARDRHGIRDRSFAFRTA